MLVVHLASEAKTIETGVLNRKSHLKYFYIKRTVAPNVFRYPTLVTSLRQLVVLQPRNR